jgi:hypothetical protein
VCSWGRDQRWNRRKLDKFRFFGLNFFAFFVLFDYLLTLSCVTGRSSTSVCSVFVYLVLESTFEVALFTGAQPYEQQ